MFETIIWATDGSDLSDSGLALVTELARVHCSKIIALHVDERLWGGRIAGGPTLADEDGIARKIEWQVEELRAAGFVAVFEVAVTHRRNPATSIAESAAELGADLIVVVSRGAGDLETLVHPSVARGLTTHVACCPVLVVPSASVSAVPRRRLSAVGPGRDTSTQVESL